MDLLFDTPKTDKRKEKIRCWAKRYMAEGSKKNLHREKELIELKESIYKQGHLTKSELEQLVRWKLPRQRSVISIIHHSYPSILFPREAQTHHRLRSRGFYHPD